MTRSANLQGRFWESERRFCAADDTKPMC